MQLLTRKSKRTSLLGFGHILQEGLVIYAYANSSGERVVSIENAGLTYSYDNDNYGHPEYSKKIVGKGATIEQAMREALIAFNRGLTFEQMYSNSRRNPAGSATATGPLDKWLIDRRGEVSIVSDEDGSIICRLEGCWDPTDLQSGHINIYGTGESMREAVRNAFIALEEVNTRIASLV